MPIHERRIRSRRQNPTAWILGVLLAASLPARADLVVGDSLNRYSLFGLERVSIGYRANTAAGGWVGADTFLLQGNNSVRSQITAGQFDVVGTADTVWGRVRLNRDMAGSGF